MKPFLVLAGPAFLAGCSDSTNDPLSPKQRSIIGSWQLEVADVEEEFLDVSYTFDRDGGALSQVSGEFLKQPREMDEVADVDFGDLENVDGGTLKWTGEWTEIGDGDSLEVLFERLTIELFGRLPIIGKVTVPVYDENLADDVVPLRFGCVVTESELTLSGKSPAEAVSLDRAGGSETADLGATAEAAVSLVAEAGLPTSEPSFTLARQ